MRVVWILVMLTVGMWHAGGVEVVLTGGVALKSWERYREPGSRHDNWWANFVRASTIYMAQVRAQTPSCRIVWIVFRPAYVTRGKEEGKDYVSLIRKLAVKYRAGLVLVDTAAHAFRAIRAAARSGDRITALTYFGHSTAHAFMLDYSNNIIGVSKQWIHEKDLAGNLSPVLFAPGARCVSYGCYTGMSMSARWRAALGVPLRGNLGSTRYRPVGDGKLPQGVSRWTE